MTVKEYHYINDIGIEKMMVVEPQDDGLYGIMIFDGKHGEYCGGAEITEKQLNELFEHYRIKGAEE